eukprot:Transcript_29014.p2 GENE.Transcript_29014~~Transcript_29014.p2  ORF type:complete len:271 (-),score=105.28 Transcript_29014:246-1058(-)
MQPHGSVGPARRSVDATRAAQVARVTALVLLDLLAAAAFNQLFLEAALLGGGTLACWATGVAPPPQAAAAAAAGLGGALHSPLQRAAPRVAAAALAGGALRDPLGLRGVVSPLSFLAFGVDALVRNALRRRALAGRVAFALRRAALLVAPLLALLAALAAADAACLRLSAAAPAAAIATAAYQHALRPLLALAGADASVAALGARLGGAAGAGALGARAAYAAAAPLALLLLPIKALLFPLVLADLAFSGAVRAAAAALGAIVAALRPLL